MSRGGALKLVETEPSIPPFSAFIAERVGPRWVLARRTARLEREYGPATAFLSQKDYDVVRQAYRQLVEDMTIARIVKIHECAGVGLLSSLRSAYQAGRDHLFD